MAAHLTSVPAVSVAGGDDASGFAEMVAGLLHDNVADSRTRAGAARLARGRVVLRTTDRPAAVTVRFEGASVVVADEEEAGAPSLAGPWLELAHVCAGTRSPFAAIATRELQVDAGHRPDLVAIAGYVLSAPAEAAVAARRARVLAVAGIVVLATMLVFRSSRRRAAARRSEGPKRAAPVR